MLKIINGIIIIKNLLSKKKSMIVLLIQYKSNRRIQLALILICHHSLNKIIINTIMLNLFQKISQSLNSILTKIIKLLIRPKKQMLRHKLILMSQLIAVIRQAIIANGPHKKNLIFVSFSINLKILSSVEKSYKRSTVLT